MMKERSPGFFGEGRKTAREKKRRPPVQDRECHLERTKGGLDITTKGRKEILFKGRLLRGLVRPGGGGCVTIVGKSGRFGVLDK